MAEQHRGGQAHQAAADDQDRDVFRGHDATLTGPEPAAALELGLCRLVELERSRSDGAGRCFAPLDRCGCLRLPQSSAILSDRDARGQT